MGNQCGRRLPFMQLEIHVLSSTVQLTVTVQFTLVKEVVRLSPYVTERI